MEPFSITCRSCAARLKVSKLSAVGQNLACPRCGTMILVEPPEGWQPPPEVAASESSGDSISDFADIESVLESKASQRGAQRSRQVPSGKQAPPSQTNEASSRTRQPATASDQPVLPGQQWTTAGAQRRKRWVLIGAVLIGGLLVIVATVLAVMVNWGKSDPNQVADNSGTEVIAQPADGEPATNVQDSDDEDPEADDDGLLDQTPVVPNPIDQSPALQPGDQPGPEVDLDPDSGESFVAPVSNDDQKMVDQNPNSNPLIPPSPEREDPPALGLDPEPAKPVPEAIKPLQDDLGDLASLLEASDTTLQDLQDQTATFQAATVNRLAKYYVVPPGPLRLDLERQQAVPIAGLDYQEPVTLTQRVRILSRLAGIPITIDARQLALLGQPVNPTGLLNLADTTFGDAIKTLATSHQLDIVDTETGLILTRQVNQEFSSEKIDLPQVPGLGEPERKRFVASIQSLVSPEIWVREEEPATIELDGNQLLVNAPEGVQFAIKQLCSKLDSAASLVKDQGDANNRDRLKSRWKASAENRQQASGVKPSVNQNVLAFLQRIEKDSGMTVLVDWFHAAEAGWTPQTEVPGEMAEETVGELVEELANAMRLVPVAVDHQTIMLTTREAAPSFIDLEVYPVADKLAQQLTEGTIERLVFDSLGAQTQSQLVKVVYEPRCQALITVAPQSIQRQVEALLDRLSR